jgi:hypothetical protein
VKNENYEIPERDCKKVKIKREIVSIEKIKRL